LVALLFAMPMALTACGGTDDGGSEETNPPVDDENTLSFETGEFEVAPGDTFTCFYLDTFTDREMAVVSASGTQGPGGHHIVVYYADQPREVGFHDCSDSEMVNLHQIAGAGGGEDATAVEGSVLGLPDGLALKVPAGRQLALQAHYINTTGAPQKVNDTVKLNLVQPEKVEAYVNYMVTLDDTFRVEPQSKVTRVSTCTLDRDYDFALVLGHMHELGKRYTLEVLDEAGVTKETLRDDEWVAEYTSHPPISYYSKNEPLHLTKGTTLRQTCTWDNTTPELVMFPREMCLAFFYYFPGDGDLICDMQPVDEMGE
jgi:hypothetical protein